MSKHNFGERTQEWSNNQKANIGVWQTPKYEQSKAKAIEMIESGKYGLEDSDFWILMNESKATSNRAATMNYTGLIISHNGCLKINDHQDENLKFRPSCVSGPDKAGFNNSLVYTYSCDDQGVYEIGEASAVNCKNAYPYAMAFKRLFDRVILKISKLAFYGVYSDSEADEFKDPQVPKEETTKEAPKQEPPKQEVKIEPEGIPFPDQTVCECCGKVIVEYKGTKGGMISPQRHAGFSVQKFGQVLCLDCIKEKQNAQSAGQ